MCMCTHTERSHAHNNTKFREENFRDPAEVKSRNSRKYCATKIWSYTVICSYIDDNTVPYFGNFTQYNNMVISTIIFTSVHIVLGQLVVHMRRSTWPVCIMYWVGVIDRHMAMVVNKKVLLSLLVERVTSVGTFDSLCLQVAQVPSNMTTLCSWWR